jgi:uncharacterized protein DUF4129
VLIQQGVSADSVAAAIRDVFAAPEYEWTSRWSLWGWLSDLFFKIVAALEGLRESHPVAFYVVIGTMAAVAIAIFVHLGYVIWHAFRAPARRGPSAQALPAVRDAVWHLREARKHGEAGRYGDALAHRFLALVLDLERRRALNFHPAKTPAEYAREARIEPGAQERLGALVGTLYRHLFGGAPATAQDWTEFDQGAELVGRSRVQTA